MIVQTFNKMSVTSYTESKESSKTTGVMIVKEKPAVKKVLEEEEYLGRMAKIIRRDFFSHIEFPNSADDETPAASSTERSNISQQTTPGTDRTQFSVASSIRSRRNACNMGLNEYLEKYTSEDNSYFEKLQKKELRRHRAKYPWLYRDKSNHNKRVQDQLTLPSIQEQASLAGGSSPVEMIDWPHNPKNTLFYAPEENNKNRKSSTVNYHSNKYINEPLFKEPLPVRDQAVQKSRSFKKFGDKIGVDGKLLNGSETPIINGYSFIPPPETPTPIVVGETRIKTDLNRFYIPKESPRDELAHRVYQEKVANVIRTPKTGSMNTSMKTPSFRKGFADLSFSPERVKTPKRRNIK